MTRAATGTSRTVLHLVGSPTDDFHLDLSIVYARGCLAALSARDRDQHHIALVHPDRTWRFPVDLTADSIADSTPMAIAEAISHILSLGVDVAVPQMFCHAGMTSYRSLLEVIGVEFLGNRGETMALAADKARTRAVVATAGVAVPRGEVLAAGESATLTPPVVVKPVASDNSVGVTLVTEASQFPAAVTAAQLPSGVALVEEFIALGREVRCGIIVRDGAPVVLPLEEYAVDAHTRPIRRPEDKLARTDGELFLVAKDVTRAWIVDPTDPINARVAAMAVRAHRALGCRHHSLFDFRIDPQGNPWFLEAGPYCSFSPSSVIAVMARAAGIDVTTLFDIAVDELLSTHEPRPGRNHPDDPTSGV
ncbi:D-alanine--D-alanine ligase [Williamsia sp. CHRR-6]|uniref:D-alanine--D-alanine ligase family protein n=1 Tax=Williamsia sp. CHRR-6 TaxID=2835871 RepID=UPI001BDB1580|nr:D-alanine--D-alanine ligase [Williamsia sp. CHRR-6]MBT0565195.1 D-alanine--D-alanine ligase [Williamsia sp. CHRR-6]